MNSASEQLHSVGLAENMTLQAQPRLFLKIPIQGRVCDFGFWLAFCHVRVSGKNDDGLAEAAVA